MDSHQYLELLKGLTLFLPSRGTPKPHKHQPLHVRGYQLQQLHDSLHMYHMDTIQLLFDHAMFAEL